jgi:hypothetical protein
MTAEVLIFCHLEIFLVHHIEHDSFDLALFYFGEIEIGNIIGYVLNRGMEDLRAQQAAGVQ